MDEEYKMGDAVLESFRTMWDCCFKRKSNSMAN